MVDTNTKSISLNSLGINSSTVHYQLSSNELHSITLKKNQGKESSLGAIAINTGEFTGRSPMDRFIVKDDITFSDFQIFALMHQPLNQRSDFQSPD